MKTIIKYSDYLSYQSKELSLNEIIKKCNKHKYDKIKKPLITIVNNRTLINIFGLTLIMTLQSYTNQPMNTNTIKILIPKSDDLTDLSTATGLVELFFVCTRLWMIVL